MTGSRRPYADGQQLELHARKLTLKLAPARGPPLWEDGDAQINDGAQIEPDWDLAAQPAPDFEVDQCVIW